MKVLTAEDDGTGIFNRRFAIDFVPFWSGTGELAMVIACGQFI